MNVLSPETQIALLLTAPLIIGRSEPRFKLLSQAEYRRVQVLAAKEQNSCSSLLDPSPNGFKSEIERLFGADRLSLLLNRGFQLSQALERWSARSIWVLGNTDASYPRRILKRLRMEAPPVLYGCGNLELSDAGGLAVVGSREASKSTIEFTTRIAKHAAQSSIRVTSGGARGVDQAAMQSALASGGSAIGVLADGLEDAALSRLNRPYLMDRKLLLISPYDPLAGFNVGNAMNRNKVIYAISDAALVTSSNLEKGGTWAGASEQLRKYRFVPIFVKDDSEPGLRALRNLGARTWPEPRSVKELRNLLSGNAIESSQPMLLGRIEQHWDVGQQSGHEPIAKNLPPQKESMSELLFERVKDLVSQYQVPMREEQVAKDLDVSIGQTRMWLKRLVAEGSLERLTGPVRYVPTYSTSSRSLSSDSSELDGDLG